MARRAEAGTAHALGGEGSNRLGGPFTPTKQPEYVPHRIALFEQCFKDQEDARRAKAGRPINIELPDGTVKTGTAFETTPHTIAAEISKGLANAVIVAKVFYTETMSGEEGLVAADDDEEDEAEEIAESKICQEYASKLETDKGELWDLHRPLEGSCRMKLLKFDDPEGQHCFWHSSAHILGQCLEAEYGSHLTVGPALTSGFYYDCYMGDTPLTQEAFPVLNKHAERIAKEDQKFHRLVIAKEQALEMFKHNPFKVALISNKIPDGGKTTCYRCGPLIDLCKGPHLPSTGKVKAFEAFKNSSAYWLGKSDNDSLQRVYAISFPDKKQLTEHKRLIAKAEELDHRKVGAKQDLYFFDSNVSPGSCFWLPMGTRIYNKLIDFMKSEYRLRGFHEVISPNIYSCDLWKTSGHYQNYKENMYTFDVEKQEWGLKPMNCPGHCIMFQKMAPSYKQLPVRLADFGVLHRNEVSGSLTGLTRVRRFQQDDAHIFCRPDQITDEVMAALDFLFFVYKSFGFEFELKLSTRPKKALGAVDMWDEAEKDLAEALESTGLPWELNPADGAFYGPKIDIKLSDALKRTHQCGTIQLDFQLPIRFNLQYKTEEVTTGAAGGGGGGGKGGQSAPDAPTANGAAGDAASAQPAAGSSKGGEEFQEGVLKPGHKRPVIIHRAILGSVERMAAILVEHTEGRFPFWLSPRQAIVCPISEKSHHYALWVRQTLQDHGYYVEADTSSATVNKKILNAQHAQWNYILVVGEKESQSGTITVRRREDGPKDQVEMAMPQLLELFASLGTPCSKNLNSFKAYQPPGSHKQEHQQNQVVNGTINGTTLMHADNPGPRESPTNNPGSKKAHQSLGDKLRRSGSLTVEISDDGDLEAVLEQQPFIGGFRPSRRDADLYQQVVASNVPPKTPNMIRWYEQVAHFNEDQRATWR
ncbi:unnamed protein product [Vitrella brassicaformis CCMP3155]|uniref:threonine--tRNA ligase n=2 Tax=Vitrella brassicaformis TaxID=1169539 RepID=A0A0G4ETV9_VITBC|nr:unnamed protein product [Vitrella brassicaformis CCMP3155]|eukprot:CEM01498.1 unnamed protein product [Vitrella brassicaformis CCMP3155]